MYAREDGDLLDALAENLCESRSGRWFGDLPPEQQEHWREVAMEILQGQLLAEPPPDPDSRGPEPGSALPVDLADVA